MSASPFDVPTDFRDLAERGVEQARTAFEGFLAMAQRTAGAGADAAGQTAAQSLAARVLGFTEQNAKAAFDLAGKLVRARDPQEVLALQSEYMKSQIAALQAQAQEIGSALQKGMTTIGRDAA